MRNRLVRASLSSVTPWLTLGLLATIIAAPYGAGGHPR